jgi:WD40 repeat protein
MLERPEFVLHSQVTCFENSFAPLLTVPQSDVLSVTFSPFHSNLVFGGTYSGQILLWDMRSKHLPVLKTPLSAAGHTHPVYAMQMVGTQNAHNLITSSTDGLVCSWLVDMLAQPQARFALSDPFTCLDALRYDRNHWSSFTLVTTKQGKLPSPHLTSRTTKRRPSWSEQKKAMFTKPIGMTVRERKPA